MTDTRTFHWTDDVAVTDLHEPTVRAIIASMRRHGQAFSAYALECQFAHGQIEEETSELATRLRQLADFTEANPDIYISIDGSSEWSPINISCEDADDMRAKRRAIGGQWEKSVDTFHYNLKGKLGDNHACLFVARDEVCERVVTGTEIKMVPDPDAPQVEREVEIVEWICPDALLEGS